MKKILLGMIIWWITVSLIYAIWLDQPPHKICETQQNIDNYSCHKLVDHYDWDTTCRLYRK